MPPSLDEANDVTGQGEKKHGNEAAENGETSYEDLWRMIREVPPFRTSAGTADGQPEEREVS